ncbi:MAG: AAA family ATPase [Planctomycetota bacterium]|jgi:general secretion pathway protein A|nr:hypothetical protein [Pirellulales bacterium]RLS28868.1 MAG: hypothetical protein DWH80_14880 [Planctomycetota bacterium]TSA04089.1 MAG: hypothetical protein D4R77_10295 [Planctomycetaceae bacterium]
MPLRHWNLSHAPFSGSLEPSAFFMAPPQDEALARLEWLDQEHQRLGIVVAPSGFGKSHLCSKLVRKLSGMGAEVAMVSLRGVGEGDWIELLLDRLPLDAESREEPLRPWQKLENRLRENMLMDRTTALLFDDLDCAPPDALAGIERLVASAEPRFGRTLVVATTSRERLASLPRSLLERAALRIELAAWSYQDVADYLTWATTRLGGSPNIFSESATETLARLSDGIPRLVLQIAQMALVAAAGDRLKSIDAATIERSWRELVPDYTTTGRSRCHSDENQKRVTDAPKTRLESLHEGAPRMRVVRRLWA